MYIWEVPAAQVDSSRNLRLDFDLEVVRSRKSLEVAGSRRKSSRSRVESRQHYIALFPGMVRAMPAETILVGGRQPFAVPNDFKRFCQPSVVWACGSDGKVVLASPWVWSPRTPFRPTESHVRLLSSSFPHHHHLDLTVPKHLLRSTKIQWRMPLRLRLQNYLRSR
jgi:hypothetical protein